MKIRTTYIYELVNKYDVHLFKIGCAILIRMIKPKELVLVLVIERHAGAQFYSDVVVLTEDGLIGEIIAGQFTEFRLLA